MQLYIIANWMQGAALSGGDRIFIELSRRLAVKVNIKIVISSDGWKICQREGLDGFNHEIWVTEKFNKYGYFINYFYRTFASAMKALHLKLEERDAIVYSSSDFWPDSIPAFLLKLKHKDTKWVAGFYLFAPKPWQKNSPYRRKFLIGLFYWLTQLPIYFLVKRYADLVFVTSQPDVEKFLTKTRDRDRVMVVRGGVDIRPSEDYLRSGNCIPKEKRKYDACFVGRFHYQKGILELVDIWELVCKELPEAKLALIGVGPLEKEVRNKINIHNLKNRIDLLGFKVGQEKYDIFKQSKIIVHPATYDSGGMAAAEGMAWALPAVGFDLESLKTYYPIGMLKVKCFDLKQFARQIILLYKDSKLYDRLSKDAYDWSRGWNWTVIAEEINKKFELISNNEHYANR